jgi:hypothetical protein
MAKNKKVNKTKLAKNLGIGRSSLYFKPLLPAKDLALKKNIEEVLKDHPAYGHRRIALHLGINKKRALRVMKLFDLSPIRKPKVPVKKDDLRQEKSSKKNLLVDFNLNSPSQIWARKTGVRPQYS